MPEKVRELKQLLRQAEFTILPKRGKGSHSDWIHELLVEPVVLSGNDGSDAKPYQERRVFEALKNLEQIQGGEEP